jgi:hypothetical protein
MLFNEFGVSLRKPSALIGESYQGMQNANASLQSASSSIARALSFSLL